MLTLLNLEIEAKVATTEAGLLRAEQWCDDVYGVGFGIKHYMKESFYFDTPVFSLYSAGVSFRKKARKLSYLLKVPAKEATNSVERLEVVYKESKTPLSLQDPFDRQQDILRRMLPFLPEAYSEISSVPNGGFAPRISLSIERRYRRITNPEANKWLASIVFDKCTARLVNSKSPAATWCEIEVEAHNFVLERKKFVNGVARAICEQVNGKSADIGKYERAVKELHGK